MKNSKKVLLVGCLATLILITALLGAFLYLYHHPPAVKGFIEKSISRSTGARLTIKQLSYSLNPLSFQAKGIQFQSNETAEGSRFELSELRAHMALEGSFGHKTLTFKHLAVDGFSIRVFQEMTPFQIGDPGGELAFSSQMVKRLIGFLLFRDIEFQSVDLHDGDIAARWEDQRIQITEIRANLNSAGLVEISSSARIEIPSHNVILNAPEVGILTAHAISFTKPEITFRVTAKKATLQSPTVNARSLDLTAKLEYQHDQKTVNLQPVEIHADPIHLKPASEPESTPLKIHLRTEGLFRLENIRLSTFRFKLMITDVAELSGELNGLFRPPMRMGIRLIDSHVFPQKLAAVLPENMRRKLGPVKLSGPLRFHGVIEGFKEKWKWNWQCDVQAQINQSNFSYRTETYALDGTVTANIEAKGRFPDVQLAADLKADIARFSGNEVAEVKPFQVAFSLAGQHPVYTISNLTTRIPQLKFSAGEKDIQVNSIEIQVQRGTLDADKRSLLLPGVRVDSSLWKNLVLSLNLNHKEVVMELAAKKVNLLGSAQALGLIPIGWQFSAVDSLALRVILEGKKDCSFTANVSIHDLTFESSAGRAMGEKLAIHVEMKGTMDLRAKYVAAETSIQIHQGEILCDRFYVDLTANPFRSAFKGNYHASGKSLEVSSFKVGLKDILALHVTGTVVHKAQGQRFQFNLKTPLTPLRPIFEHLILEPFQTEKPFLATMNLGGAISSELELTGNEKNLVVVGTCKWHEGELSSPDYGTAFQGINLSLPLWYQTGEAALSRKQVSGALSINVMTLPLLPKQSLRMKLVAGPNSLSVNSPTDFDVPGGKAKIGPIMGSNIFSLRPIIETSLVLPDVEVNPILSGFWSHPTVGTIGGKLDPIVFEGGTLSTRGKMTASVFDGKVILTDLHASGIFSSSPLFGLNARWHGLNLEKLTTGTAFGKIEGILEGYVRDLEIAYREPQKFDLLLETVKKRGVRQMISVRAVENIAQIGGGQSPFMGLAGGFAAFFRKFPYRKMGVHAALENDIFRVNGTIREGGTEYLVKRGGFSGVNIVNQSPDNRISFKDMVKRIKRVTAKGSGGPIIK